jgi:hypothetical protein
VRVFTRIDAEEVGPDTSPNAGQRRAGITAPVRAPRRLPRALLPRSRGLLRPANEVIDDIGVLQPVVSDPLM